MLGCAALATPCAYGRNVGFVANLFRAIGPGSQFDEGVQGHVHPRALRLVLFHEIGVDAAQNGLVRDNENVFAALKLHDDGFEADDNVAVRLSGGIAIVVLVVVTRDKILGIPVFDFLVGQAIADTRVELVQRLPLQLVVMLRQPAGSGDGAFQCRGPYGERAVILCQVSRCGCTTADGLHTPTDSRTSSGNFFAYSSPRGESIVSPPIRPSRLYNDSPCWMCTH